MSIVEITNLTVQYPDIKALDDVSFTVNQGDFLGIIGPNGAGKSTLFDAMLSLNTKYKGTIKFFGEDIKKLRAASWPNFKRKEEVNLGLNKFSFVHWNLPIGDAPII